jgi:hypothetical protein
VKRSSVPPLAGHGGLAEWEQDLLFLDLGGGGSCRRSCSRWWVLRPHALLACCGGEEERCGGPTTFQGQYRRPLPTWCYSSEINQAAGDLAVAIQGREDDNSTTSDEEAMARLRRGCSNLLSCEVICSPQDGGGPRLRVLVGRGLPSSWPLFLGGDALRTPATCDGGTRGLNCFFIFSSRVFYVNKQALSSNIRFLASVVRDLLAICTCHMFSE